MSGSLDPADNPVARGARAAAQRLESGLGSRLTSDVEAALHTRSAGRPEQYLDPISLAALIVSAASLAWTIYADLKTKTRRPAPQVIARRVRIELADNAAIEPTERERIIDVVVTETIQAADD